MEETKFPLLAADLNKWYKKRKAPLISMMNGRHKSIPSTKTLNCQMYTCIVKEGTRNMSGADMVVFAEHDMEAMRIPPKKHPTSLWAFLSREPQNHIYKAPQNLWDGVFNYSVTYDSDTDGNMHIFRDQIIKRSRRSFQNFAAVKANREPNALWFVSHCTENWKKHHVWSARAEYALELSKYITIDVFTKEDGCRDQLRSLIKNANTTVEPGFNDYTFYLAFESTLCKDYVSEKLWKILEANIATIPIALGGLSIEEYTRVAPPRSFIHVKNFSSPKALADHLKYVAKNDAAFNYYLQWRNDFFLRNTKGRQKHDVGGAIIPEKQGL
ncbi:glycoprotein 3-alpha-L-fucosyltransferase A-like [Watersipora subatra]|uniref:glycoprotein 3-alpha-L-fucosyltransferase A-like n=1 Tax=Watersipora subatra TaxID=2589382 RepID=UPI00355BCA42